MLVSLLAKGFYSGLLLLQVRETEATPRVFIGQHKKKNPEGKSACNKENWHHGPKHHGEPLSVFSGLSFSRFGFLLLN